MVSVGQAASELSHLELCPSHKLTALRQKILTSNHTTGFFYELKNQYIKVRNNDEDNIKCKSVNEAVSLSI